MRQQLWERPIFIYPILKSASGGGGLKKLTCKEVTKKSPLCTESYHRFSSSGSPPTSPYTWVIFLHFQLQSSHPSILSGPPPAHLPHNHWSSPPYVDSVESRIMTRTHLHQLYRYHHHHICLCRCFFTIHPSQIPA